jgi:hypothetical protein
MSGLEGDLEKLESAYAQQFGEDTDIHYEKGG